MPKATNTSVLSNLQDCYILIPELGKKIFMNNLPEISDAKSVEYSDEPGMGRASPFKAYGSSANRTIGWKVNFFIESKKNENSTIKGRTYEEILDYIRTLEACVYPQSGSNNTPYTPPPICRLKCGQLLSKNEISAVMKQYQISFDTSVPWDNESYLPYKVTMDLSFDVIYDQRELPGADKILNDGY